MKAFKKWFVHESPASSEVYEESELSENERETETVKKEKS